MEKLILPKVGAIYKSNCEVREVIGITDDKNRYPDVIFMVPEKKRHYSQWLPLWSDWAQNSIVINGSCQSCIKMPIYCPVCQSPPLNNDSIFF